MKWQQVVTAYEQQARSKGRIRTGSEARWWYLKLACGHTATRSLRYSQAAYGTCGLHKADRQLPAPKKVVCGDCVLTAQVKMLGSR